MATYATYFHLPTVGHDSALKDIAKIHPAFNIYDPSHVAQSANTLIRTQADPASASHNITNLTSQQSTSLLFRLPGELRNQIYKLLLCPDAKSLKDLAKRTTDLRVRRFNQTSTQTTLYPAILSTCRRVYQEANELLYTPHTFHAHTTLLTSLPHLLSASRPVLDPNLTSLITRWQICLRLDTDPQFTFGQATKAFSGAEYLEVRVWQAQYEACDYAVLKLFMGIRGVKVARVGGSVDVKLAGWLEELMMRPQEKMEGGLCGCEEDGGDVCAEWEQRREVLCGRCYKKLGAA